jgi:capsular exopolysaccharide synthesis family protein
MSNFPDQSRGDNGQSVGQYHGGRLVPASPPASQLQRQPYGPNGGYGIPSNDQGSGLSIDFSEYIRTIIKRKWLILSIMGSAVALGAVSTMMATPLYTAAVRLQIDRSVGKVVEGGNITPMESAGSDTEFLRTQYELLQSRALAARVASAQRLGADQDFMKSRSFSLFSTLRAMMTRPVAPNASDMERAATALLMTNRAVKPISGSRLVDVTYADPNPARAQIVAMSFADAFIASNLDKRFEANTYAKTFLEDQIKQLKIRLEASETALLDFAQREQIVVVNEKASITENNLSGANAALGTVISERIKNEQLWKQVEASKTMDLPQLLSNGVIDGLRTRRNALVTEYQEKLETFKPGYPAMVQINNKIREIDRQLASEVATVKASFKASYESALSQENEMKARIEGLRAELLDLQKRSIEYNILKREVDTNRGLYNGLLQRFKEVDIASGVGTNNVFIVDRAEVPRSPSSPQPLRAFLLSLVIGLSAGLGAAFLIERFDDTVRSPDELERSAGITTLGVIPKIHGGAAIDDELADPRSAVAEAYRSLCTALQFSTESGLPRTLVITSAGPAEGKSSSAVAISRHFATMGLKVLIIDADLRNPSLHKKMSLANEIGLSNYLTGVCTPPETFQATNNPNLAFMASGPLPPNAADLLGSSRLASLFTVGLEVFDLIVIDAPPVMGLADVPLLATVASATVFIVGSGQARKGHVRHAIRRLQQSRVPVIGAVLTKFDTKLDGYGYGYGYNYNYSYGATADNRLANDPGSAEQPQLAARGGAV